MNKKIVLTVAFSCSIVFVFGQKMTTLFETSDGRQSPTYFQIIDWWKKLDLQSGKVKMQAYGVTDAGYPLHLILIGNNGDVTIDKIKKNNKRIILINNGIHPGEPDGIDASMLLARDIVENIITLPRNVVLAIIPVYNIEGCLNRSENFRADQNGPDEFGFRGNGQNLDLNRDFIKCDSKNARSFTQIFQLLDPDVFIDNHVSNGADYQHIMTLISSQHSKLGGSMGAYLNQEFEPAIYQSMKTKGYDLIPYVNIWGNTPDKGWNEFFDSPRYSSGYGSLWSSFCFVPETHMLKSYKQRVEATFQLLRSFIDYTAANSDKIKKLREASKTAIATTTAFPISWTLNKTQSQQYLFKGYETGYKISNVSQLPQLFYDRTKPYEKLISINNRYEPLVIKQKPRAYIIPQGWWRIIELLQLNKVKMQQLKKDTMIRVEAYTIEEYQSGAQVYESHHVNSRVKTSTEIGTKKFLKGDWLIFMNQAANRFLMETLEPEAEDSYFAWNYFDGILSRKEGFSAYAFEDIAAQYLKTNPELQKKLQDKRLTDSAFAKNADAQLNFVYLNSPWAEPAFKQYPVFRIP